MNDSDEVVRDDWDALGAVISEAQAFSSGTASARLSFQRLWTHGPCRGF